jgi:hypothetical protein
VLMRASKGESSRCGDGPSLYRPKTRLSRGTLRAT